MKLYWSELWDGAEPPELEVETDLDAGRVRALVRARTGTAGGRKRGHTLRTLLLAAALTGALTLAAGAAVHFWSVGELFADYFGGEGEPVSTGQVELMDGLGTTFEGGSTCNGATITPLAAIADENVFYLKLQLEAPEGTVLPEYSGVEGEYRLSGPGEGEGMTIRRPDDRERMPWGWTCQSDWLPDEDPADNVKEVVLVFQTMAGSALKFNDGASKPLLIRGLWLQSPDGACTEIFRGDWELDIGGNFEGEVIGLETEGLTRWDEDCQVTVTLEEAAISPLTLSYRISHSAVENRRPGPGLQVVMKDGAVLETARTGAGQQSTTWAEGYLIFDSPIDLEQVDCVRFGTETIEMPAL